MKPVELKDMTDQELCRYARKRVGVTQHKFGFMLGYKSGGQPKVSQVEKGRVKMSGTVRKLCKLYAKHGNL